VRVPDEAGNGIAKIHLSFADCEEVHVASALVEVTVVDAKPDAQSAGNR
jgi:hypothetical protein